jgi:RND family efflux transporter MFP subunit
MKSVIKTVIWLLALAIVLYLGLLGMRSVQARRAAARAAAESQQEEGGPITVKVEPVRTGAIDKVVWVTGDVQALKSVDIVPKVAGRLECFCGSGGKLIAEGDSVAAGDVVARIEDDQFQAMLKSAEAALDVAGAAHDTAKVNLKNALREKDRWTELRKGGAGTDQQLDQAVTAYELSEALVRQTQAQIAQAEAAVAQARVNLEEATIDAPFAGIVSRKYVDEGAFVGPSQPLFKLVDTSQVEVTGGIAGRYYPEIAAGKTAAEVEVDAYPGKTYSGVVDRVRPELDRATRTAAVTIRVANDRQELKPGMYARIRLVIDHHEDVALIPDDALMSDGVKTRVYVVNGGVVESREVSIGLEEGVENEVLSGLAPGDKVVVSAKDNVRDGAAVRTEEAAQ